MILKLCSGAELQELQNEWEDYAFPPVGTAKFVLGMSIIQFIVKVFEVSYCDISMIISTA